MKHIKLFEDFLNEERVYGTLNESGTIKIGGAISSDLTDFLTTVVVPKSKGYVHNERDAAALLLDIIKHRYNF